MGLHSMLLSGIYLCLREAAGDVFAPCYVLRNQFRCKQESGGIASVRIITYRNDGKRDGTYFCGAAPNELTPPST